MDKILIQGRFINADEEFKGQIEIDKKTGLISRVGEELGKPDFKFRNSQLIFPGMGDIHIHAREDETGKQNHKEEYSTAAQAAINGGVVHVIAMPNTPSPLTTLKQLEWHKKRTKKLPITVLNYVGIGPGTKPLKQKVPYKVYTGPSVGQLFFRNENELRESLKNYKDQLVSFHVEDFEVLEANKDKPTHTERRPVECVEVALENVLDIIEKYNLKAKLCHWSTGKKSFEMIKKHRKKGFDTKIEVSPLHLYFDEDMLKEKPELWPYVQMNPALQSKEHRFELIKGLKEGFIDYLATDHAPHTLDEKFKNFGSERVYLELKKEHLPECQRIACMDSVSGTPQLDTYSLICAWLMTEYHFKAKDIARVASFNPGQFVNQFLGKEFGKGFGRIEKGYQGSLTVIDLGVGTTVNRENLKTKVKWSPFEGITFSGSLKMLMIKGQVCYKI